MTAASIDSPETPVKTGRPRIEDRAKTIEARKPWLKLGMSRRTGYRRQAEKRTGGKRSGAPFPDSAERA
jgi:hypothetical protein